MENSPIDHPSLKGLPSEDDDEPASALVVHRQRANASACKSRRRSPQPQWRVSLLDWRKRLRVLKGIHLRTHARLLKPPMQSKEAWDKCREAINRYHRELELYEEYRALTMAAVHGMLKLQDVPEA